VITGKPEHLKTFDYLGLYRYFLTFCTHERRRLFENADAVLSARTQIERAALENPLKAGLVERIADYPFLGSNAYTIDQILEAVQLPDDWRRRSG